MTKKFNKLPKSSKHQLRHGKDGALAYKLAKDALEPSEHDQQCSIFRWADLMLWKFPELKWLRGSMNGVRLTIGQAVKAKKAV